VDAVTLDVLTAVGRVKYAHDVKAVDTQYVSGAVVVVGARKLTVMFVRTE